MCKRNRDAAALLRIAFMTISILCIPSALFAQRAPNEATGSARERVFAPYDKSLNEAADAVLATSAQEMNDPHQGRYQRRCWRSLPAIAENAKPLSPKAITANATRSKTAPAGRAHPAKSWSACESFRRDCCGERRTGVGAFSEGRSRTVAIDAGDRSPLWLASQ